MMRKLLYLLILVHFSQFLLADEGMWLPFLLERYTIEQMQAEGFKLTAKDIYDINNASMKDAVVGLVNVNYPFRHFCTGELVSSSGLMLTNHHCGYGFIQKHSSLSNNLLDDGFWAMSKDEELPNDGLGAVIFKRMEDVTSQVFDDVTDDLDRIQYDSIIQANIKNIEKQAVEGTNYIAEVNSFFAGNEFYLSVYELFTDVRLVGAPPSAIGKFGGDTDNWMWPRHTGDFCMFRIYADSNNNPSDYRPENIPFRPSKYFEISTAGVKKSDFTMVMGYPGYTQEYLPSYAIKLQTEVINPIGIFIRDKAINIMKSEMDKDEEVRIKYSAKVAVMANSWKKWLGENRGLIRLNAVAQKEAFEQEIQQWIFDDQDRTQKYGSLLYDFQTTYHNLEAYKYQQTCFFEAVLGAEIVSYARNFNELLAFNKDSDTSKVSQSIKRLESISANYFKDFDRTTNQQLFVELWNIYYQKSSAEFLGDDYKLIETRFNGNTKAYLTALYEKSIFNDSVKVKAFLKNYKNGQNKMLANDPVFKVYNQLRIQYIEKVYPFIAPLENRIAELNKIYMQVQREYEPEKAFYPDANSTFRIAFGMVEDYQPCDGVQYLYQTSLSGIIDKENPEIYDYKVPQKLKELYYKNDFGPYGNADSTQSVCFIATNHTTGGNSGSPVLNSNGRLIGINFDRDWEGTMSDLMYDPSMCRNIVLDIRYLLFIVDKYAGATNLINEMTLVNDVTIDSDSTQINN